MRGSAHLRSAVLRNSRNGSGYRQYRGAKVVGISVGATFFVHEPYVHVSPSDRILSYLPQAFTFRGQIAFSYMNRAFMLRRQNSMPLLFGYRVALVGLVAFLAPQSVAAQIPDSLRTDTTSAQLRELRITAPRASATVGGASVVVVAIDSLRLTPAASLEDGLREIPFVLVRQNSRGEVELSVRGSDSRQAAVMFDGIPLTAGWDGRADPSAFPLSGVTGLVLVRGLSSLLYGPNTLGGVVDIGISSSRASRVRGTNVQLGVGLDQLGTQAIQGEVSRAIVAGPGEINLRVGAGRRDRTAVSLSSSVDDQYATKSGRRSNSDLQQTDGFGAVRFQTEGGAWVGGSYSAYELERGVMPELHLNEPRFWRYPNQSRDLALVSAGTGRRTTPLGRGDMEVVVGTNASSLLIENFLDQRYDSIVGSEAGRERTQTGRLLADHSLGRGEVRTALSGSRVRYRETLNGGSPSEYEQRLWSSAVEVDYPLAGTARLSAGWAADGASTPQTGGKESLGRLSEWGGRLGVSSLAFGGNARVHTSVSRRARFASLRELYSGALNRFDPNPTLRPERLVGMEAGATMLRAGSQFQAVVFHHRLEDAIVRLTLPNGLFRRVNRDRQTSTGLELLAGITRNGVSLSGDLLVQHVRIEDPSVQGTQRQPEHQPALRSNIDLVVPLPSHIRGRLGLNYTGRQYCVNPDIGGNAPLKSQTLLNGGAEREFRLRGDGLLSRLIASISLDNLGDSAFFDQCGLPYAGRTVRIGVGLR